MTYYDAYEKDIAIVNVFFGEPTAYGESIDIFCSSNPIVRVREVAEDDLVGLHLRRWRPLWTLSWDQLCLPGGDSLLVFYQTLQQNLNWI